jgi:aryl-alcohol dehydrogenase-like predicted oxidoreductase
VEERVLGQTGRTVSVIGLGTWQLGAIKAIYDQRIRAQVQHRW